MQESIEVSENWCSPSLRNQHYTELAEVES